MFKKLNKKGFTLAELLVVVAIIGVLVAISIPIFTAQLEKARDAVSVANIRAAYAEAQTAWLTGSGDGTHVVVDTENNKVTVTGVKIKGHVASDKYSGLASELPFTAPEDQAGPVEKDIVFTYTADSSEEPIVAWE